MDEGESVSDEDEPIDEVPQSSLGLRPEKQMFYG